MVRQSLGWFSKGLWQLICKNILIGISIFYPEKQNVQFNRCLLTYKHCIILRKEDKETELREETETEKAPCRNVTSTLRWQQVRLVAYIPNIWDNLWSMVIGKYVPDWEVLGLTAATSKHISWERNHDRGKN